MGTGRRFTYLVTVFALVLGLVGSIAPTRAATGASQGLDSFALQGQNSVCLLYTSPSPRDS